MKSQLRFDKPALEGFSSEDFGARQTTKDERYRAYKALPSDETSDFVAGVLAGVQYAVAMHGTPQFGVSMMSMSHRCARILIQREQPEGGAARKPTVMLRDELDPNHRVYSTRIVLSDTPCHIMRGARPAEGDVVPPMADLLFSVRGISAIQFMGYDVMVQKSAVFEWSEIEPKILATLESGTGEE